MTEIEKKYFEDFKKIIDTIIPDFENQDEAMIFISR